MPTIVDVHDYNELFVKTRGMNVEIDRYFGKRLKDAADTGARVVRIRAAGIPGLPGIGGPVSLRRRMPTPPTGLRAKLAANISVESGRGSATVSQGALGITGRSSRALPRRIDEGGTFSHPVYGHAWRARQMGYRYFQKTFDELRPVMEAEVSRVLDDIADHVT